MTNRKTSRRGGSRERRISVRGIRRTEPDIRKLSQALIALALAQAEADAEEQLRKNSLLDHRPTSGMADSPEDVNVA